MRPNSVRRLARLLPLVVTSAVGACGGADTGTADDTAIADPSPSDTAAETILATFDSFFFEVDDTTPTTSTTAPDSGGTGDDTDDDAETSEGCRTFGCQCSSNADCLDEQCIEAADGSVCTRSCVADCPANFDCLTSSSFGDPQTVCVPRHTRLCRPCRTDAECQATNDAYPAYCLAAADPDQGSFCGSSCANRDCPEGYACQDAATAGGGTARQCVPNAGMCECRSSWAALGFSTDCVTRNEVGGCDGTRQCTVDGLSACNGPAATTETCDTLDNDCNGQTDDIAATACTVDNANGQCPGTTGCGRSGPTCLGPTPAAESCNGLDDNCNTQTDEAGCDDGLNCTTDACASPNNCKSTVQPGYCVINSACWLSPQYNPQNACEMCDANKSTNTWSQTPNTCAIGGACYPASATNPQNACQICNPNQSTTSWTTSTNTCQIGGQCYLQNDINPANTCEICSPATSTTTWTLAFNTCNIQGQCYAAGAKKPGASCYLCDPTRSTSGWSTAANGTICDDNNECSPDATDKCNGAGVCLGNTACDDNLTCTTNVCNAQTGCNNSTIATGCLIAGVCRADQFQNPQNQCQWCDSTKNKTGWTNKPANTACDDGLFCTDPDKCNASGACGGAVRGCGDAYDCTNDGCNETANECTNPVQSTKCKADNQCHASGDLRGELGLDSCKKCIPSTSTTAWTFATGASCNDNNHCTQSDTCASNACTGSAIPDGYESNNSESAAKWLGTKNDSDNWPQWNFSDAYLYPANDIDWYEYEINDTAGGNIEPYVYLDQIAANHDYKLCVYFYCVDDSGPPSNLDCGGAGGSSTASVTVAGRVYAGCCENTAGNAAESMRFEYSTFSDSEMECDSSDDHFRALVQVTNLTANSTCDAKYRLRVGDD